MSLTFNEKTHRYRLDKKPVTGATTLISGGIPKPALVNWAARTVAEFVDANPGHIEHLRTQPPAESGKSALVDALCKVPTGKRDEAALRGTKIHDLGQRYLDGEEIEIPPAHEAEVMGLVDFLETWELEPLLVENSLANREHWYSGRVDFIGTSPHLNGGDPVLIDWKTSNGVYGETALQAAAYALADFWVTDDDPDTERPLPYVTATYVAHIIPGKTDLHPLASSREEIEQHFEEFLAAAYIHKTAARRKKYVAPPLAAPSK